MLFALTVLSGACAAEDVVDVAIEAVAPAEQYVEAPSELVAEPAVEETMEAEVVEESAPVEQSASSAEQSTPEAVEQATATELPGVRIEDGPVSVIPSPAVTEQNIEALAEVTVEALKQSLQEAQAHITDAIEDIGDVLEDKTEEVLEQTSESFIEFLTGLWSHVLEFVRNGWKYMIYNEIGGATKHILASAPHRSVVLDLSSLEAVDGYAAQCLAQMNAAKSVILAAAEAKSPAFKNAAEACLAQYYDWFTGKSMGFVAEKSTEIMLKSLNLRGVSPQEFNVRNVQLFYSLGGDARSRSMFLAVSPNAELAPVARSVEGVSADAAPAQEAAVAEDAPAADEASVESLQGEINELLEEVEALQEKVDDIEEMLVEELIDPTLLPTTDGQ